MKNVFRLDILSLLSDVIFGFIEGIITLRILLKFLDANPFTPFVSWVYDTSAPLLSPFQGMFPSPVFRRGFTIEIPALFTLLTYAFLGYLVEEFVDRLRVVEKHNIHHV